MTMTILQLLEDDEGERVKTSFSKKKIKKFDGIFVNYMNLWSEQDKTKIQEKHELVLSLTLNFDSILQKANVYHNQRDDKRTNIFISK